MQNGMTYMVRPCMLPRYSSVIVSFISAGSTQLFVGPASASSAEQMNVRSSTRATSPGSVRAQNEFGFLASRTRVPAATSWSVRRFHSSRVPSHQTMRSGSVSLAMSATHLMSAWCSVGCCGTSIRRGAAVEVCGGRTDMATTPFVDLAPTRQQARDPQLKHLWRSNHRLVRFLAEES